MMYLEHSSIQICRAFKKAVRNRAESYQIYYLVYLIIGVVLPIPYSLFPLTVAQLTVNLLLPSLSPKQTENLRESMAYTPNL